MKKKVSYNNFDEHGRVALSLYSKYVLDPLARVIALPLINYTSVKPYQITILSLLLAILSAFLFWKGYYMGGAVIFQLSAALDSVDGYIARIKGSGSAFGIILDYLSDQVRVFINIGVFAILFFLGEDYVTSLLLALFLYLSILEHWFTKAFFNIERFWKTKSPVINKLDRFLLGIKNALEARGIKFLFLHYHEILFLVLFLGPVFGAMRFFVEIAIAIALLNLFLKILLDTAMVKDGILTGKPAYLTHTTGIKTYMQDK